MFDFGRHEVRNFLVANALYWLEEFHLDGLRVDAVASMLYLDYSREHGEWLPNIYGGNENLDAVAFLQETNATVGKRVPGAVMIAEESTAWPGVTRPTHLGGLGFHLKWNMGWMHDTPGLRRLGTRCYRSWHHNDMTFSHDVRLHRAVRAADLARRGGARQGLAVGQDPRRRMAKAATLRAYYAHMWAHPGKQLLFMGSRSSATRGSGATSASCRGSCWITRCTTASGRLVGDLNRVYQQHAGAVRRRTSPPPGSPGSTPTTRRQRVRVPAVGFRRSVLACIANFAAMPHGGYRVGLPFAGPWREAVNTDAEIYGGSGAGNMGAVVAEDVSHHGQPASVVLTIPPLGALWLVPDDQGTAQADAGSSATAASG